MLYEPCWKDYEPKREVDKMRDTYRFITGTSGTGLLMSENMIIDGTEFKNPMKELINQTV